MSHEVIAKSAHRLGTVGIDFDAASIVQHYLQTSNVPLVIQPWQVNWDDSWHFWMDLYCSRCSNIVAENIAYSTRNFIVKKKYYSIKIRL